jgi:hypothetical protein
LTFEATTSSCDVADLCVSGVEVSILLSSRIAGWPITGSRASWDLDVAHPSCGCAFGDEEGQQRKCVLFGGCVDRPPDGVPTGTARGERRPVAKRASVTLERGEHDAALVWLVTMLQQVARHEPSLSLLGPGDIGAAP